MKTDTEFRSLAYVWNFLKKSLDPSIVDSVKGMRPFTDYRGAAFDIPEEHNAVFEELAE